ncbi:ras association domain-containing protein 2 isoform X3 [Cygnus atratus]|uniref:ras association domain-containing protein 2 isoform X3 n=1 Tax=Cygnus atratus TaxID=8868 RepID=UPI0021B7191A|nr:ras association domain-containing protein 2 isoform X3 [Cygnus atratus]XP_050571765.1 ras association domain-containing protein 2 isoform X3 [Cygnus atratus]
MDYGGCEYLVPCGKDKYISKNELLLHLKTYNIYYEGQNLQLRHREEEGELIVEGLLNISWGLRRPIRLQMQDDNQRIRPPPSSSSWHSGCNLGAHGLVLKPSTLPDIQVTDVDATMNAEGTGSSTGETEMDLAAPLRAVPCSAPASLHSSYFCAARLQPEEPPQLLRTRSDVGVRHRGSARTPSEQRRIRRHRFSINGHFYNHKTSVFTPAYGSVTNVRINSTMTTPQVLKLLLNKFKIENSAEEFALYIVHTSGEKQKLRATDYPLIARILQGPCEQVSKVFLMEKDQVEEVTYDVAQYIKFEMPVLRSFIQKLEEEEDREVKKLMRKYSILRLMIEQRLEEISEGPARL